MRALRQARLVVPAMVVLGVVLLALLGGVPARQPAPGDAASPDRAASPGAARGDRGVAPAGSCAGVAVAPGDDLRRAVEEHPAGTTFCLQAGVHHPAGVVPKDGQRFIGAGQGTVLSGARTLAAADARRDAAGRWYWTGQTQRSSPHGTLVGTDGGVRPNQGDRYNEELFVTASGDRRDPPRRYQRVLGLAELGPGRWLLDRAAGRIYLADDPARLGLIETSVVPSAITAPPRARSAKVLISNLVVEKYASAAQQAAVGGGGAVDWDLRDLTVRYSHGAGAELGPGTLMENCRIQGMGQVGLLGGGDAVSRPTTLRDTEVSGNKALSFDPDWEAGGAKFTRAFGRGMVVERSWFHDNQGGGLWFDIDNYHVVVRSNRFEANRRWGLLYEVSRDAQIYGNQVLGTSRGPDRSERAGAGIVVFNSADVDVHHNLLRDNDNGVLVREDRRATRWAQGSYRQGLPHVHKVDVHDNDLALPRGVTGMQVEGGDATGYWRPVNVRFAGNTYRLDATRHQFLGAGNHRYTFDQWRALGNDRAGHALPASSTGALPDQAAAFAMRHYGARDGG